MKNTIISFLILLSLSGFSQTKQKSENPVDILELKCLDKKDMSNAEMCKCTIEARASWDKVLNKYYFLLKTKLSEEAFEVLKDSQKQWINYRDKEYMFISKFYFEIKKGTMWYAIAENEKKEIVKNRATELEKYYELLDY